MDNRPNTESGQHDIKPIMGTMTMTPRTPTSGMGPGTSLPPLMEVLGDYYNSRSNMPRSLVERESPILERRAPLPPAISSIGSMLDLSSSPPSSKRRKLVNSPPYMPLSLTRPPARRAVSDAPENEGSRTTIEYSGYTSVYPPRETEQRRLSSIPSPSHPEIPGLPPVSAITSSRGSSFESERPLALSLPSIFGQSPTTTVQSSSSRYPYETDYQQPSYRSSCDQPPSYPSPSPSTPQYTSSNPPLLTHPYPSPRGGTYMPRPSQPTAVSWHDRSPFSPSLHGSTDSYEQVARLGTKRRRGNLPKHVTDTLRSWLTDHVAHPYPTEEEKQQLCQITGLNMNQISNWFINARRRKLPQQRTETEQHLLIATPPRASASLGHTPRSHSHDASTLLPPPHPPQGPFSSSGR